MKEIGGYFELELNQAEEYHPKALRLNSGRNALLYLLQKEPYQKIMLPYYICNSVIKTIKKAGLKYEFYHIDENLLPKITPADLSAKEALLFVNYFGLINPQKIQKRAYKNIIADYSQAFYAKPSENASTFYSSRKFFGVPDGAYLYTKDHKKTNLNEDVSFKRYQHLLIRLEKKAIEGFKEFKKNEKRIEKLPLRYMSNSTQKILSNIHYEKTKKIREDNFLYLHQYLNKINELKFDKINGPMIYPLLVDKKGLRSYLKDEYIYTATYWEEVLKNRGVSQFEKYLAEKLVALPIDQRYTIHDMKRIIACLKKGLI